MVYIDLLSSKNILYKESAPQMLKHVRITI